MVWAGHYSESWGRKDNIKRGKGGLMWTFCLEGHFQIRKGEDGVMMAKRKRRRRKRRDFVSTIPQNKTLNFLLILAC